MTWRTRLSVAVSLLLASACTLVPAGFQPNGGAGTLSVFPASQGVQGETGPKGLVWRGPWASNVQYAPGDAVEHDGSAWIAIEANTNSAPSSGNGTWNLLAKKGDVGPVGPQGPKGDASVAPSVGAVKVAITAATVSVNAYAAQELALTDVHQKIASPSLPVNADMVGYFVSVPGSAALIQTSGPSAASFAMFVPPQFDVSKVRATLGAVTSVRTLEIRDPRPDTYQIPGRLLLMFPYTHGGAYGSDRSLTVHLDGDYFFMQGIPSGDDFLPSTQYSLLSEKSYQLMARILSEATVSVRVTDTDDRPMSSLPKECFILNGSYYIGGVTEKSSGVYDIACLIQYTNPGDKRLLTAGIKNIDHNTIVTF